MNKKIVNIILGTLFILAAGFGIWKFIQWRKVENQTQRNINNPGLREMAKQAAMRNGTSLNVEARKMAKEIVSL